MDIQMNIPTYGVLESALILGHINAVNCFTRLDNAPPALLVAEQ
jgi:hypothetical protein